MDLRQFFTNSNWWGKLIGAFFGYLMGGPLGALFGIFIGNFFDKGLTQHFTHPQWHYYAEKRKTVQKVFFETTFAVMGYLAKADGRVTEKEIHLAKSLMHEMGLTSEQKEQARQFFTAGKSMHFNLEQALDHFVRTCHDNQQLLKLFLDIQYRAAQTDGLSEKKIRVLDRILNHFGMAPLYEQYRFYQDFDDYSYEPRSSSSRQRQSHSYNKQHQYSYDPQAGLNHAFAVLEVSPNASKTEVKKAYRRLMSKNHPDKLIAQGLPEEMIKIANEKTQKISKAYEQICTSKGW